MIIHLNDDHHWDRERIATWLTENGGPKLQAETKP
jgi:hypothetical protein